MLLIFLSHPDKGCPILARSVRKGGLRCCLHLDLRSRNRNQNQKGSANPPTLRARVRENHSLARERVLQMGQTGTPDTGQSLGISSVVIRATAIGA